MDHQRDEINFSWQVMIRGAMGGTINYEMQGIANTTFQWISFRNFGLAFLNMYRATKRVSITLAAAFPG